MPRNEQSVRPLTREQQVELFRQMTARRKEKEREAQPLFISSVRFDGSRDALMFIEFASESVPVPVLEAICQGLKADHPDYVSNADWKAPNYRLISVTLQPATRYDPNRRRRARGDLPKIVSAMFASLQ